MASRSNFDSIEGAPGDVVKHPDRRDGSHERGGAAGQNSDAHHRQHEQQFEFVVLVAERKDGQSDHQHQADADAGSQWSWRCGRQRSPHRSSWTTRRQNAPTIVATAIAVAYRVVMPEGDTIRRLADKIAQRFTGQRCVRCVTRDPRLVGVDLAGAAVVDVDAIGKHLLIRFDNGTTLHSHLQMTGSWTVGPPAGEPEWRRRIELWMESGRLTGVDLPVVELVQTADEETSGRPPRARPVRAGDTRCRRDRRASAS